MTRLRLENLANQGKLCADCLAREQRDAEMAALAERVHRNIQTRMAERTPDELREEAQDLLDQAQALEAAQGEEATDPTSLRAMTDVEPSGPEPAPTTGSTREKEAPRLN
jgi:hypothetical protein